MWVPIGHYPHFSKLAIRLKSTALVSCSILTFVWHLLFFLASAKSLTLQRYMISLKGMKCDSIIGTELPWINSLHSIWQMLNISMFPLEIWNIPWKTLCHYNLPGWLVVQFGNHGIKARVEIGWPTSPSPWGFFFFSFWYGSCIRLLVLRFEDIYSCRDKVRTCPYLKLRALKTNF